MGNVCMQLCALHRTSTAAAAGPLLSCKLIGFSMLCHNSAVAVRTVTAARQPIQHLPNLYMQHLSHNMLHNAI
jgi:hypothetical protein